MTPSGGRDEDGGGHVEAARCERGGECFHGFHGLPRYRFVTDDEDGGRTLAQHRGDGGGEHVLDLVDGRGVDPLHHADPAVMQGDAEDRVGG